MPLYECTFITRPELSQQDVQKYVEKFTAIINEYGGKIVKNEYWGLRNLAYRVKKNKKGHYNMMAVDAPPAAVKEVERNISISEDIIRKMTIRVESISDEPSAILQQKSYADVQTSGEDTKLIAE